VAGSSYAHLGVATEGESVAVFSVIDNLLKGAAGGGVQWLNRMLGLPQSTGLSQSAPGWI
jgi:N-acetyl-gamma-glutamyl-phosphate reductase